MKSIHLQSSINLRAKSQDNKKNKKKNNNKQKDKTKRVASLIATLKTKARFATISRGDSGTIDGSNRTGVAMTETDETHDSGDDTDSHKIPKYTCTK